MTLTDKIKTHGDKIKANQAQYDLDSKAGKISELTSKELENYEYLMTKDLRYQPG